MEITGSQKVHAPQQQVFQALLNPEVLKNSIPGCESGEMVDMPAGRRLKLVVTTSVPGFKGPYNIFLHTGEVIPPSHVVLITEPSSSIGTVKAVCAIDLSPDADGTIINYNATANLEGKIAAVPEIIVKGGVKAALEQFFKNFDKNVRTVNV